MISLKQFVFNGKAHRYSLLSSLSIVAFLVIFQPFNVGRTPIYEVVISIVFVGAMHYLLLLLFLSQVSNHLPVSNRGTEFLWILLFVILAGLISKTVHGLFGLSWLNLNQYIDWMVASTPVLAFPHALKLLLLKGSIFSLAKNKSTTSVFKYSPNLDNFFYELPVEDLYYIQAMENYVNVVWQKGDKVQKKIFRMTLSTLEELLQINEVQRVHRSFIINTNQEIELAGNARGYKIFMNVNGESIEIPLSRNKLDLFTKS